MITSIISYPLQPFYTGAVAPFSLTDSGTTLATPAFTNESGITTPDLSDYTTINAASGEQFFQFTADAYVDTKSLLFSDKMTIALIGCALLTYEDDGGGPDLDTLYYEDITCSVYASLSSVPLFNDNKTFAHNSSNRISTIDDVQLPGIISGGLVNLVCSDLPASIQADGGNELSVRFTVYRSSANVTDRPHAKLIVGHLFVGADLTVNIDPNSFSWSLVAANQKHTARDFGRIISEGSLVRRCSGELVKIEHRNITGSTVESTTTVGGSVVPNGVALSPNLFDLAKANSSYPVLMNPYPKRIENGVTTETAEDFNLSARQNFFSIYGFMESGIELRNGQFRNGVSSLYGARFSITETR